jgi:hypothetical protein
MAKREVVLAAGTNPKGHASILGSVPMGLRPMGTKPFSYVNWQFLNKKSRDLFDDSC